MRQRLVLFLSGLLLGGYMLSSAPIGCELGFRARGRVTEASSFASSQAWSHSGLLFSTSGAYGPVSVTPELRGPRQFQFSFSENVTEVRLRFGSTILYEGPPISAFDASGAEHKGFLTIEPRWSGDALSLTVSDKCTLQTVAASVFR